MGKSWATQDSIQWLKVCPAAPIHYGNVDIATLCVMYEVDTSSACSYAR